MYTTMTRHLDRTSLVIRAPGGIRGTLSQYRPIANGRLTAAVALVRSHTLAWADLYRWLRVVCCCGAHPLLDLPGHGQESLLNVVCVLR